MRKNPYKTKIKEIEKLKSVQLEFTNLETGKLELKETYPIYDIANKINEIIKRINNL
jgi:hypothetical protein